MAIEHYPYISQWADPADNRRILAGGDPCDHPRWRQCSGFTSAQEYRFWSWRLCGVACFQSVLLRRRGLRLDSALSTRHGIWRQAMAANAFIPQPDGSVLGLIYAPFVRMIGQIYGIAATVDTAFSQGQLADYLAAGRPVMASVAPLVRHARGINPDPGRNGGHLVLCYALDRGRVWFNNPSATEAEPFHSSLPLDVFYSWCAGRGVIFCR